MIWTIAVLLLIGALYTVVGQENRTKAELLQITRDGNIKSPDTYNIMDREYRRVSGRAFLQMQAGKVFLFAGLILMIVKAVMELLS